jgi:hypothetical protein
MTKKEADGFSKLNSFEEKQKASEELFKQDTARALKETSPVEITPTIEDFARKLGGTPVIVPVVHDQYGLHGWCSDGVIEKVRHEGGAVVFGWTIWEWPGVILNGEFHAVWANQNGTLLDITPKPQGEQQIIFVPMQNYPQDFNFKERPRNRRIRTYVAPDLSPEIARRIAGMKPSQRTYELHRATKAGLSLEQWIRTKFSIDPLPKLIDDFIVAHSNFEEEKDIIPGEGLTLTPKLKRSIFDLQEALVRLEAELMRH